MGAIGSMVTLTPFLEDQSTLASWNPTTPCWTPGSEEAFFTTPVVTNAVSTYNEAMDTIASLIIQEQVEHEPQVTRGALRVNDVCTKRII